MANIVLLGDPLVGKSTWLMCITGKSFSESYAATISKGLQRLNYRGRDLIIHDIGGNERFHDIVKIYYEKADGAIVMYDVHNEASRLRTTYWISKLSPGVPYAVVGNKADLDTTANTMSCKNVDNIHNVLDRLVYRVKEKEPEVISSMLDYILGFLRYWLPNV
jgi:small GTP-binding protein